MSYIDCLTIAAQHAQDWDLPDELFKTTRKTDAEPLLKRAHGIVIQSLKPEHPTAQSISANYLAVLQSLGKSPAEIQALMAPPAT